MVGPGTQRNKPHKAGRRAGRSAREKHHDKKDASQRTGIKASHASQGRADRMNAAKQLRDRKRSEVLEARRAIGPPIIVGILPLSDAVDVQTLWDSLIAACSETPVTTDNINGASGSAPIAAAGGMEVDTIKEAVATAPLPRNPLAPITLSHPERRKARFTFLPPLVDRTDPLAVVELGRSAEVVLCVVPGDPREIAIDSEGLSQLAVLRALGLPTPIALVQLNGQAGLKDRSAAKKFGADAFFAQVPGDHKVFVAGSEPDYKQIMRHLADSARSVPQWRRQRPQVMVQGAEFLPNTANPTEGSLVLTGYVRYLGLSATQLIHIPTAGDFQIEKIEGPPEPPAVNEPAAPRRPTNGVTGMEAEALDGGYPVLDISEPSAREPLVRENEVDPLDAEQTWPTEEELADAAAQRNGVRKRRLPKGISDYQAAWILDDDEGDESDGDVESEEEQDEMMVPGLLKQQNGATTGAGAIDDGDGEEGEGGDDDDAWQHADAATEVDMEYEDDEVDASAAKAARRAAETDDVQFPDEIETPQDVFARERFARYRGLKSFRTSPWDPREDLPSDYSRVYAFENFRRAYKRAKEAANRAPVHPGTFVRVHVIGVPAEIALRLVERVNASITGAAPVVSCWGLLQHEAKLSVVNYSMKKLTGFTDPVANKEELLLVTGLRSFTARPILSTDEHGADKHKMERFLHEGRPSMATVFAPISYAPLPVLAFKALPGGRVVLAASGSLRDCNPDRVVLKKIVLTGYPVRVHKVKAVVKFMFHRPEDIRWFRPVELWTKQGRRGRIREPIGTHGSMKCIFDGPLTQQDAVCMSLFKRVYPKWPESDNFA